jgi:hypothetical protein
LIASTSAILTEGRVKIYFALQFWFLKVERKATEKVTTGGSKKDKMLLS